MHTPQSFHDCERLESARPSSVQRRSDIYPYLPRIWLGPLQNRYSHFKFEAGPLAPTVLTPIFTGSIPLLGPSSTEIPPFGVNYLGVVGVVWFTHCVRNSQMIYTERGYLSGWWSQYSVI